MGQRGTVPALLLAVMGLGGCAAEPRAADASWRTSTDPVHTTGLAWAAGSTVHLADGTTIEAGQPVRGFVVAGDGVFFVPSRPEDDAESASYTGADLWFVAPGEEPVDTDLSVASDGLRASPDGRHLVSLEADYDSGEARMRFLDLESGEEVVSEDGMDTSGIGDRVDHLLEMEVQILHIDDRQVWARVIEGDHVYDLATGAGRPLEDDEESPHIGADSLASPDGAWRVEQRSGLRDVLVSASGSEVTPRTGTERWTLTRWVDDDTAVGVAIDGPGTGETLGPEDTLTLMTCDVPRGDCELLPDTAGEQVVLATGTGSSASIDLRSPEVS